MHYVEINKEQWPEHCESFALQHHGWLVNVRRVTTADLEEDHDAAIAVAEPLAVEQPLQTVSVRQNGHATLTVSVGEGDKLQTFEVRKVHRLWRERADGAHQGLRIDSDTGTSLLVEFRSPARPEELDGLAASEL